MESVTVTTIPASRNRLAAIEQDGAAGGAEFRKMRLKSGNVVTVSLAVSISASRAYGVLRFKHDKMTFRLSVGRLKSMSSKTEVLAHGWKLVRDQKIVEKNDWGSWVVPTP
jgi:hypothetical protein